MDPQHDQPLFGTSWVPAAFRLAIPSTEQTTQSSQPSPFQASTSVSQTPKANTPRSPPRAFPADTTHKPEQKQEPPAPPAHAPKAPVPPKAEPKPVSTALAIPVDYTIRDLGIKDVDLILGGSDPTSKAVVAFPVRRMNIISASSVLADLLKSKPPPFGHGPDSLKFLPYLKLEENALLIERILPFMFNDLDLPKTTDIHFVRAVYQAAHKYKMRRLFDWMTEKLR